MDNDNVYVFCIFFYCRMYNYKVSDFNFVNSNFAACNVDQFHAKLERAMY